jgi:hypothetical protein
MAPNERPFRRSWKKISRAGCPFTGSKARGADHDRTLFLPRMVRSARG